MLIDAIEAETEEKNTERYNKNIEKKTKDNTEATQDTKQHINNERPGNTNDMAVEEISAVLKVELQAH